MPKKPKPSVRWWRMKLSATARCTAGLDEDDNPIEGETICGWQCPHRYESFFSPGDREIRQRAKEHAQLKVGHTVVVVQRDVAYYVCDPEEIESSVEIPSTP